MTNANHTRPLANRVAIVTGAGSGIGAATAQVLSHAGARVVLVGRREAPLQFITEGLTDAVALPCDVTEETAVANLVADIKNRFGQIDILVNNAGAAVSNPVERTSLEDWNAMLAVNLTSIFLLSRAVLPHMKNAGFGRIINVASTAGLKGYAYVAAYSAAKHGVIGLTRSMALEYAKRGITINAVCPGFTETPLLAESIANIMDKTGMDEEGARRSLLSDTPVGRFTQPDEVAEAILYLSRNEASGLTGQAISISGGEVMTG